MSKKLNIGQVWTPKRGRKHLASVTIAQVHRPDKLVRVREDGKTYMMTFQHLAKHWRHP